ncbi:MAG: hypothetical protein A2Y56_08935 [Candidatus Aminicenantes bacterium RBG_13_63_10]|nr:MAG: hypothetical protein A2Y56_08935 [Candidatus Aminicenantes bacterium RBG_13_63_10]
MIKKPFFAPQTAAVTDKAAVMSDDAMAGHEDGQGIFSVGRSYGSNSKRAADRPGDIFVGCGPAIGHAAKLIPNLAFEFRSLKFKDKVETSSFALEILLELPGAFPEHGMGRRLPASL